MTRIKVKIVCKNCGERFILRGRKDEYGIETGFKQCICNNRERFEIIEEAE